MGKLIWAATTADGWFSKQSATGQSCSLPNGPAAARHRQAGGGDGEQQEKQEGESRTGQSCGPGQATGESPPGAWQTGYLRISAGDGLDYLHRRDRIAVFDPRWRHTLQSRTSDVTHLSTLRPNSNCSEVAFLNPRYQPKGFFHQGVNVLGPKVRYLRVGDVSHSGKPGTP